MYRFLADRLNNFNVALERKSASPAFAGWLLGGLTVFYFAAATNTMSGWLYVISGVNLAILVLAGIMPVRALRQLQVHRRSIAPVSAGDEITVEIEIENLSAQTKNLFQVYDCLPYVLGKTVKGAIETIPPHSNYLWTYYQPAPRRGIYRWSQIELRTGTPLGLFWCRRAYKAKALAVVYPIILSLNICPLIDQIGKKESTNIRSQRRSQMSTEGITRTLRPYRFGDPTRLIHWRSSARYGELRVRELEMFTGSQEVIISLDSAGAWDLEHFEQAAIVAASLFFYASRMQMPVQLWTAQTGLIHAHQTVLQTLAGVTPHETLSAKMPENPIVWLTQNQQTLNHLPPGSRWILWPDSETKDFQQLLNYQETGIKIQPQQPLEIQLQQPMNS